MGCPLLPNLKFTTILPEGDCTLCACKTLKAKRKKRENKCFIWFGFLELTNITKICVFFEVLTTINLCFS